MLVKMYEKKCEIENFEFDSIFYKYGIIGKLIKLYNISHILDFHI